jgi:hypothetical protein
VGDQGLTGKGRVGHQGLVFPSQWWNIWVGAKIRENKQTGCSIPSTLSCNSTAPAARALASPSSRTVWSRGHYKVLPQSMLAIRWPSNLSGSTEQTLCGCWGTHYGLDFCFNWTNLSMTHRLTQGGDRIGQIESKRGIRKPLETPLSKHYSSPYRTLVFLQTYASCPLHRQSKDVGRLGWRMGELSGVVRARDIAHFCIRDLIGWRIRRCRKSWTFFNFLKKKKLFVPIQSQWGSVNGRRQWAWGVINHSIDQFVPLTSEKMAKPLKQTKDKSRKNVV